MNVHIEYVNVIHAHTQNVINNAINFFRPQMSQSEHTEHNKHLNATCYLRNIHFVITAYC